MASSVLALGILDVVLAAKGRPVIAIGRLHESIPHTAVNGVRYVVLASALALIGSTWGLLHGKRHAWLIAVTATMTSLGGHPLKRVDLVGVSATAVVLGLLAASVRYFPARSDPIRARRGLVWLALGEAGVLVYGVAGLYFLDHHFVEQTTFSESMENAVRLLFVFPATTIDTATRHGAWFIDSVRAGALAVLGIGMYHLLHPVVRRRRFGQEEYEHVRRILEAHATSAIAYFHLLDDKHYFFSDDGSAFIGYHLAGHTAVALGEPIGPAERCVEVARAFAEFCDLNGWAFCYHQVTGEGRELLDWAGLSALKVGEEAIIELDSFTLAGKPFKHIRNAINRLQREGYTIEELPRPLPDETVEALREVSDAWLADGRHRERTFSLGAFSAEYVRATTIVAVLSPERRIEAFANLVPPFRSGQGNFDMMRRRPDAPDGVMDFLFTGLAERFRAAGLAGMNLGFAPLSNLEGSGVTGRALRLLYTRGGRAFNFEGLHTFKDKWNPRWEPRYLVYRSDLQLPQLALAVARAGERNPGLLTRWLQWRRA